MKRRCSTLAVLLLLATLPAAAQTAIVTGQVSACTPARCDRIPGATVTLTSAGSSIHRTTVSDANGYFAFVGVPSGTEYVVESQLEGFIARRMTTWYLFSGQTQNVPLPLDIVILGCTLGQRSRIDQPQPEPGTFRLEQ